MLINLNIENGKNAAIYPYTAKTTQFVKHKILHNDGNKDDYSKFTSKELMMAMCSVYRQRH